MRACKETDYVRILEALKYVKVAYLEDRGGGVFGTVSDSWDTKLSLGEQQRIAVARLLLKGQPATYDFAFLDECTSAVALDGEEEIYKEIARRGTCCVTASQKPWLLQFHSKIMQITENAHWDVSIVPHDTYSENEPAAARLPDVVYEDARQTDDRVEEKPISVTSEDNGNDIDIPVVNPAGTDRPKTGTHSGVKNKRHNKHK